MKASISLERSTTTEDFLALRISVLYPENQTKPNRDLKSCSNDRYNEKSFKSFPIEGSQLVNSGEKF